MKKFYMLIAAVMISGAAMAQSPVKFGLKAGGNFANINTSISGFGSSVSQSSSSVTSFYVGGLVTVPLGTKLSFQPELLLSSQGTKGETFDDQGNSYEGKASTLYLNLPLMFRYNIVAGLNGELGPQVGFLLSAKDKVQGESFDSKDAYKSLDFGVNVGAEYQFPMGLFLNARYNWGLANIAKEVDGLDDLGLDAKVTNRVLSLGVGFRF